MSDPQSSFYSFMIEPMVDLEPGITAEEHHSPDSFNIELEQSMGQGNFLLTLFCRAATKSSPSPCIEQNVSGTHSKC